MLKQVQLGRTGLSVTNICFGTGGLTNGPDADTPERVERARDTPMVTTAIDQRRVMSMLTIAFLALAGCVGIPRGEAMGAISDNGQEGGPPAA